MKPLAEKVRPEKFQDIVGQDNLIGPKGIISRLALGGNLSSIILYGHPGIGKTTIAKAICNETKTESGNFNASCDTKAKLKDLITEASHYESYFLIVDEIHRMTKNIQDYLLPFLEKGVITLIGLTTINPYHSVNPAIRSRCMIYKLNDLNNSDLEIILYKTLKFVNSTLEIEDKAAQYLISMANGEVRTLINYLDAIINLLEGKFISFDLVQNIVQKPAMGIDKNGDSYFQTLSGLQKSIRGSDVDASLHYLAKLIESEDLPSLVRRLEIIAYEDIGLANPSMGSRVKAACDVALDVGFPEARIPLSVAVCDMALSPKSNSAYLGIKNALEDLDKGNDGPLPPHLKNTYDFDASNDKYKYPHDYPNHWVYQQYLPDKLKGKKYFTPTNDSKYESALKQRYDLIEKLKQDNIKNK